MDFTDIILGFNTVFYFKNIIAIVIGTFIGMFFGAMPGLSCTLAVALALPFTFKLEAATSMLLLAGIYCAGTYAGSITAILINTPGTSSSVATSWDGYPLTKQGRSYEAMSMALNASVLGGLISSAALLFFAPNLAKIALAFGPAEKFTLTFFGLTIIARVSGKNMSKGLLSALIGLLSATVGMDPIRAIPRLTFSNYYLYAGIDMIPVFIGIFAIAEIFRQIELKTKAIKIDRDLVKRKIYTIRNIFPYFFLLVKSSIIGIIVGAIPGTGGSIASFIAYDEAKRSSKEPQMFGRGSLEGIAAAESANNGTTAAALIPALTLGIPGTSVAAIFVGALMIHGLIPGPLLFVKQGDIMASLMIGFFVANLAMYLQGYLAITFFDQVIVSTQPFILFPIILVMCLVGSYTISHSLFSVFIALAFGILGYLMEKFDYPGAPLIIGLILGRMVEITLRQSLIISDGNPWIFFTRPISLLFIILTILVTIVSPILRSINVIRKSRKLRISHK